MERTRRINLSNTYAIPKSALLEHWGLEPQVFDADEARKEKKLSDVMELPSWYYEVLGNINDLDYVIVSGERGSGKSALRRNITQYCETEIGTDVLAGTVLCITMDHDSPNWIRQSQVKNIPIVDSFCQQICEELVISFFTFCDKKQYHDAVTKEEMLLLERYLYALKEKKPDEVKVMADSVLSVYKVIKGSEEFRDIISIIKGIFGKEIDIDSSTIVSINPLDDIQRLINIIVKNGFDAVYVLVDEIDEFPETGANSDYAAEVIASILSNLNLLEKGNLGFKFFLPVSVCLKIDEACRRLGKEIRYDRTLHPEPFCMRWTDKSMHDVLKKRLMAYSNNSINSLKEFASEDIGEIDDLIVKYAHHNPRHLIQLCDRIVRITARTAANTSFKITKSTFEQALDEFTKQLSNIYPKKELQPILDMKKEQFTDEEFLQAAHADVDKEVVISALKNLEGLRAIKTKVNLDGHLRCKVIDPRIIYRINKDKDEEDW